MKISGIKIPAGVTITAPATPTPQGIARVQYFQHAINNGHTNGYTKTVTDLQENDVMFVFVQAIGNNYSEPPTGWTQISGAKRSYNRIPGHGVIFNAYYKVCDNSGSHTYEVGGMYSKGVGTSHLVAYRNLRVADGASPIGAVSGHSHHRYEIYPAMDLHQYNNSASSDDDSSWVLFFGQHETGTQDLLGPTPSGGSINVPLDAIGDTTVRKYTFHEARDQTEDVAAHYRYILNNVVYHGGQLKNVGVIGIGIELLSQKFEG